MAFKFYIETGRLIVCISILLLEKKGLTINEQTQKQYMSNIQIFFDGLTLITSLDNSRQI